MKIQMNGMSIDTKTDWGYKTDEDFIEAILEQSYAMKTLLSDILKILKKNDKKNDWEPLIEKVLDIRNFQKEKK